MRQVFSMAKTVGEIREYLQRRMDAIIEHIIKLYFYRDTRWKDKWKTDIFASCPRIYKIKGKNRVPKEDFIYYELWGSWEDSYINSYNILINNVITKLEENKDVSIDFEVMINNPKPEETYRFIDEYMRWLSKNLAEKESLIYAEVRTELDRLLRKYPF